MTNELFIENASYFKLHPETSYSCITATIDGIQMSVPLDPNNRHYAEILRQVEAGTLVIQEADNV